ncbi:aminotransferase class V-fold PLP-dependent enzyme [Marinigracilibium pacificum]|uniref:phosphoserine transaminase n=1 Tax=Marinigracilibium pacificum TaxID=2729599 RepID=A0A848J505_9BACT|nr:aminotransferase class V-fold PLP-dependent enzyme [Marinigracilibium pacificum]NMM50565.1 alanine--glyoxylate aminotransferase family protein [Marinigracilibium pacificum]
MSEKLFLLPGPSRVDRRIPKYLRDAYDEGFMSFNHRSPQVIDLYKSTVGMLKKNLNIPADYTIAFVSSATECWQIIAQSIIKKKSVHCFNGSFGEKWFNNTSKLGYKTESLSFDLNKDLPISEIQEIKADTFCITHNETSNGTALSYEEILALRQVQGKAIICVDATSSMAGYKLPFNLADIWYASVQKCFGLPAGLGVMVLSPRALERAYELNNTDHYNSLVNIINQAKKFQTTHTPNILNIYLLNRVMSKRNNIEKVEKELRSRYKKINSKINNNPSLEWLIEEKSKRSITVLALKYLSTKDSIHNLAEDAEIILGKGYGNWKDETFRIANFPALKKKEVNKLLSFLEII